VFHFGITSVTLTVGSQLTTKIPRIAVVPELDKRTPCSVS
jgi:hypothetical protein